MNFIELLKLNRISQIDIIGKGQSSRFYNKKINSFSIGFNIKTINDINFDACYFSQTENISTVKNLITLESIKNIINKKIYTGSIEFELGYLLIAINNLSTKKLNVNLYGFDFRFFSMDEMIYQDNKNISLLQRRLDIESQRTALTNLIKDLDNLVIKRYGFEINCDFDPRQGSSDTNKSTNNNKVEIVAEITTNHFGDTERLTKLIIGAAKAGADSIKLQMRDVDSFYDFETLNKPYKSPFGKLFRDYRLGLELTNEQINNAIVLCKSLNINLFFSVLDLNSYKKIINFGFKRVKLPSTISNKKEYLLYVSNNVVDEIVISTGMTDQNYINFIIENFKKVNKLYLLHCISSYPTYYKNTNLNIIKSFNLLSKKNDFNLIPGYS